MTASAPNQTLIDALVEKQVITPEQLQVIRSLHAESGASLEQIMIDTGVLSEDDLAVFINDVLQVRFLKLEDVEIDREAVKHVPAMVAHRHSLIPFRRSGNALAVVFPDPTNSAAMNALHAVTDFEIIPFMARADAIEHALYLHYGEAPVDDTKANDPAPTYSRPQNLIEDDRISHMGKSIQVDRQWTFEQFVSDGANQFPLSVAHSVAELQPDAGYNPFSYWGPPGCGKSHLMHAIANYISTHSPLKRFILTTGQKFADNLFEAIRDQKLNLFRYLYRELDVLMIDDADALIARDWAQAELVETFNALTKRSGQLVLASRGNIVANSRLSARLRELLERGVIANFGDYSVEAKLAMVSRKKGGTELAPEMLTYLVRRCGDSVSDLMSLLQQVTVMALRGEREINQSVVDELIRMCGLDSTAEPDLPDTMTKAEKTRASATGKSASRSNA